MLKIAKRFLCCAILLLLSWTGTGYANQGKVPVEVWQWAETNGSVRIFVHINVDVAFLRDETSKQQAITNVMSTLLRSLAGTKYRQFWYNPGSIAMEAGTDALAVLDTSPLVQSVRPWFPRPRGTVPVEVWQRLYREVSPYGAGLIVLLHTNVPTTLEGALHQSAQRQTIAEAGDRLVASLQGTYFSVTKRLTIMPIIGLWVDPDGLALVDRSPLVKWVVEDRPWPLLPLSKIPVSVWQRAETKAVRIIVRLHTDIATTPGMAWDQSVQRRAIAEAQDRLKSSLVGTKYYVTRRLVTIPVIGLEACLDTLLVLDRSTLVEWVLEDGNLGTVRPPYPMSKVPVSLWQGAEMMKSIQLSVSLVTELQSPISSFLPPGTRQRAIAEVEQKLLASLAGAQHRVIARDPVYPRILLVVGLDALAVLDTSPFVEEISSYPPVAVPAVVPPESTFRCETADLRSNP